MSKTQPVPQRSDAAEERDDFLDESEVIRDRDKDYAAQREAAVRLAT